MDIVTRTNDHWKDRNMWMKITNDSSIYKKQLGSAFLSNTNDMLLAESHGCDLAFLVA